MNERTDLTFDLCFCGGATAESVDALLDRETETVQEARRFSGRRPSGDLMWGDKIAPEIFSLRKTSANAALSCVRLHLTPHKHHKSTTTPRRSNTFLPADSILH